MQIPIHPMLAERTGLGGATPEGGLPPPRGSDVDFGLFLRVAGSDGTTPCLPVPPDECGLAHAAGVLVTRALSLDPAGDPDTAADRAPTPRQDEKVTTVDSPLPIDSPLHVVEVPADTVDESPEAEGGEPAGNRHGAVEIVLMARRAEAAQPVALPVPGEESLAADNSWKSTRVEAAASRRDASPLGAAGTVLLPAKRSEAAAEVATKSASPAATLIGSSLKEVHAPVPPETAVVGLSLKEVLPDSIPPGQNEESRAVQLLSAPPVHSQLGPPEMPVTRPQIPEQSRHQRSSLQLPHNASERAMERARLAEVMRPAEGEDTGRADRTPVRTEGVSVPAAPPAVNLALGVFAPPGRAEPFRLHEGDPLEIDQLADAGAPEGEQNRRLAATPAAVDRVGRSIVAQIAQAIARPGADGTIEIRLQPEELGRVRLTLVHTDSGVTVTVTAERPETLDLIRRNIDMLETDLRGSGFADLEFSFGQESHPGGTDPEAPGQRRDHRSSTDAPTLRVDLQNTSGPIADGRVDIRM